MSRTRLTDRPRPDLAKMAAREAGISKFQGRPCKHGHDGLRYSSTGNCVECVTFYRERKEK